MGAIKTRGSTSPDTGWVVDHFSYAPALTAAGLLGPLRTLTLFLLVGTIEPRQDGTLTTPDIPRAA